MSRTTRPPARSIPWLGEVRDHVLLDRPVGGAQVVGVAERQDVGAVVAEERQAAVERRQLVEVERVEADRVAEDVARGGGARVQQGALVERRPHHGAPSPAAARTPEREPVLVEAEAVVRAAEPGAPPRVELRQPGLCRERGERVERVGVGDALDDPVLRDQLVAVECDAVVLGLVQALELVEVVGDGRARPRARGSRRRGSSTTRARRAIAAAGARRCGAPCCSASWRTRRAPPAPGRRHRPASRAPAARGMPITTASKRWATSSSVRTLTPSASRVTARTPARRRRRAPEGRRDRLDVAAAAAGHGAPHVAAEAEQAMVLEEPHRVGGGEVEGPRPGRSTRGPRRTAR